jgi:integrase
MVNDLIEDFFTKKLITADNTKRSYQGNIKKYFKLLNKDINKYFNLHKNIQEYEDDLTKIYAKLNVLDTPLLTRRTFFNSIKQFMATYDKRTKTLEFWENLKNQLKGASPISDELVPNVQDLKDVLSHGNAQSRSMFLIMCSSGCRIGELLALTQSDINTKTKPLSITIKKTYDRKKPNYIKNLTKTKKPRISFISSEAYESYLSWMKIREDYLKTSICKSKYGKDDDDSRIFPMSDENARTIWKNLVLKSGLYQKDENTNRLTLHPHCLRKFFRSYLGNSDLAEHLMGHASGMDKHYRNMKIEDLAKEYQKYVMNVTIFETHPDLTEHTEEINKLKADNQRLKDMMEEMKAQITEMRLERLEKENGIIKEKK